MIRVFKSEESPESLSHRKGYNVDDVTGQLLEDQEGKCYLCERTNCTDYEVDYRHSRSQYPDEVYDWNNLLLICGYCNKKKSGNFDDIVDPLKVNVEELITQRYIPREKRAAFELVQETTSDTAPKRTIALLDRIFNGTKSTRTRREERFFEYFMSEMNTFNRAAVNYLESQSDEDRQVVIELLGREKEFLGFKYWVVMRNSRLKETFGPYCKWNRK